MSLECLSLMNMIFAPYLDQFSIVFIDDILLYLKASEDHAGQLKISLQLLRDHSLYAKLDKCAFWME